jgi:hypothetical protein
MSFVKPTKIDEWVLAALKLQLEKSQADLRSLPQCVFPDAIWGIVSYYATDDPRIIDAMTYTPWIQAEKHDVDLKRECHDDEDNDGRCSCITHITFSSHKYHEDEGIAAFSMLLEVDDYFCDQDVLDAIASMRQELYEIIRLRL